MARQVGKTGLSLSAHKPWTLVGSAKSGFDGVAGGVGLSKVEALPHSYVA